jgi:thioredoxin reductase
MSQVRSARRLERRRGDRQVRRGRRDRAAAAARAAVGAPTIDAVVVGGGPAGLSAALVLGRARRRVLVLDTGRPANAVVAEVGGLLGHTGVAPADLRASGRRQLAEHDTVDVRMDEVLTARRAPSGLAVTTADGGTVRTKALLLAHGLRYEPPDLPGIGPMWGRSVFHCPFCDGWEVRDRPLAVHGNGRAAARSALVVAGWSDDVVLCTDGPARLDGERAVLRRAGVRIREERIRALEGPEGRLGRIVFDSGSPEQRDALFVSTRRSQPNGLAAALGCRLTPEGTIPVDGAGRTPIPGVYAAGDAATPALRSVANAMGGGSRAAHAIALDLVRELAA